MLWSLQRWLRGSCCCGWGCEVTPKLRTQILKHVKDGDTVTDDDCWIWQGATARSVPIIRIDGASQAVRRAILTDSGVTMGRYVAVVRCLEPMCVSPGCVSKVTRADVARQSHKHRGAQFSLTRRKRISDKARERWGKLTIEKVREIAASTESERVLAERYGVTRSLIGGIRRGDKWRDYTNPFAGLGAL